MANAESSPHGMNSFTLESNLGVCAKLAEMGGRMQPLVLDVRPGNLAVETDREPWNLITDAAAVPDRPNAWDIEFTWTLKSGTVDNGAVAVSFEFSHWSPGNYVFAPSAVYKGNRFAFKRITWPTYLLYCDPKEHRLDAPTTINDCPRLNPSGPGRIDLTTGSVATPLMGFYAPATQRGWMVMTSQGNRLGNHGLSMEENTDQSMATFQITSPAIRRTRADGSNLLPSDDMPARWQAGDSASIKCRIYAFNASSVTDFLRFFYEVRKDFNTAERTNTLPFSTAAQLLEALYREHRWDENAELFRLNDPGQERIVQIWQLGWVGGGQVTLPLLLLGDAQTRDRARRNLQTIFTRSQAPSGFFYSLGDGKTFISDKSRPQMVDGFILLRKNADWLYMAQRQFQLIEAAGESVPPAWKEGLRRQADAFARIWKTYGQFGQWADVETGELKVGGSANCAIVCGALALASGTFQDASYLEMAESAARKYHQDFVLEGYTGGGPGEALSAPDSESAFALLESFMTLHEVTGSAEWLRHAADLIPICSSWTTSYDFQFPAESPLGRIDARSCGSVWASIQNKHGAPGICTWSGDSLLKYYRATGEERALELLADIAHGIMQYISRADRPMGGMKPGGICERVNLSDWEGKEYVGGYIFDSCSWVETAVLLTVAQIPGLYVQPDRDQFTVFDHILVEKLPALAGHMKLKLTNPTAFPAEVSVLIESAADRQRPMPLLTGDAVHRVRLDSGSATEIVISETHNPVMMESKDT